MLIGILMSILITNQSLFERQDLTTFSQLEVEQEVIEIEETEEKNIEYPYSNYRQTYYSIEEGEVSLGSQYYYGHPQIKNINNVMNFNDEEYGLLPIVAIDMNEVLDSGLNEKGTPNVYGSVIEVVYPDETVQQAIVLDACGSCRYSEKIDLWVYENNQIYDVSEVKFRYIRYGWE